MAWPQTPVEKLIYRESLKPPALDAIATAIWTLTPNTGMLDLQMDTPTYSQVRVSGLTANTDYDLNVKLITAAGQEIERCTKIHCAPC